ncbi:MAG TPA: mechanosensitive ion channel family protein [Pyrinomonadaceae bacterium]|nr:mechanosensitive ion channel family protein [Pyrinomonadaceae bacterium]
MPASDFRKKAAFFIIFTGIVILILLLIPIAQDVVYDYFLNRFGIAIGADGTYSMDRRAGMMAETSVPLVINLFRIIRILLWMAIMISLVRFLGNVIVSTIRGSQSEVSSLVKTVFSIIIYIVSFFIIFQSEYPDVPLAPLFTGSTILGIVVGLAVQDTLGNLFAGIALQADQPFQVGDVVTMMNRQGGVVESVSWRGVKIRTFQNKLLVMSNTIMGKEMIEVAPRENLNARLVFFSTLYTSSPAKTIQAVRDAVRQVDNVSQKIRPVVRIRNLGDNGLDWEVKYWADDYTKHDDTDALIRSRIWYVFNREKIEFAYPTRTVHVAEKLEETTLVEYVNTVSEKLQQVPLFLPLREDELERVAKASTTRVYAQGEEIVRRGQDGSSMFVIVRGSVKVQIPENDYQKTINELRANDFFGEMSLLTGQPRTATVIADSETEVIQIKKSAIRPLFEANPDLMKLMRDIIEERRALLVSKDAHEELHEETEAGVLTSIRKFFGLR